MQSMLLNLGRPRLLVFGDLILDRYTTGTAERISPEAPVPIIRASGHEVQPGGAASVAYLARGLDADVTLAGVVGDDAAGRTLLTLCDEHGINRELVQVDADRPTTTKERFVASSGNQRPHQLLRVDFESRQPLGTELEMALMRELLERLEHTDAVLMADYAKGVCSPRVLRILIDTCNERGIPILVDPARISDYMRYRDATLLKPNRVEAGIATAKRIETLEDARDAARALRSRLDLEVALITLDRDGMVYSSGSDGNQAVSGRGPQVVDITGAGDMVLAALGLCLGAKLPVLDAVRIANTAAALETERWGIAPISRSEIAQHFTGSRTDTSRKRIALPELETLVETYRQQQQRIVFTNGCFDLLHAGHIQCLEEAAALGDVLVVAVNADATVARLKGPGRPVIRAEGRCRLLAALGCVDHVLVFEEDTPDELLRRLKPDVLVKGGTSEAVVGEEVVRAYGGQVCKTSGVPDVSTTRIVRSLKDRPAGALRDLAGA